MVKGIDAVINSLSLLLLPLYLFLLVVLLFLLLLHITNRKSQRHFEWVLRIYKIIPAFNNVSYAQLHLINIFLLVFISKWQHILCKELQKAIFHHLSTMYSLRRSWNKPSLSFEDCKDTNDSTIATQMGFTYQTCTLALPKVLFYFFLLFHFANGKREVFDGKIFDVR